VQKHINTRDKYIEEKEHKNRLDFGDWYAVYQITKQTVRRMVMNIGNITKGNLHVWINFGCHLVRVTRKGKIILAKDGVKYISEDKDFGEVFGPKPKA